MCFRYIRQNPKTTEPYLKQFVCTIAIPNMIDSFSVLKNKYNVSRETLSQLKLIMICYKMAKRLNLISPKTIK
ncbi:MAG: hypothetical protein CM15mP117_10490 [Alphaproteobacteria bacterium]|nr:MAG: hypothetical protein CM15mP117_10490 [Alphaproteobacteria bacterium]